MQKPDIGSSQEFRVLEGSYFIWQEMFSHMTHDALFESSVATMTTDQLQQAFRTAKKFEMTRLCKKYVTSLKTRMTDEDFVNIFNLGIASDSSVQPLMKEVNYRLTLACLDYLWIHAESLLSKTQQAKSSEILHLLRRVCGEAFFGSTDHAAH